MYGSLAVAASADDLRQRAERCLRLADQCSDRMAAIELTQLAVEYHSRATELEEALSGTVTYDARSTPS
jgi:hypothetical protein